MYNVKDRVKIISGIYISKTGTVRYFEPTGDVDSMMTYKVELDNAVVDWTWCTEDELQPETVDTLAQEHARYKAALERIAILGDNELGWFECHSTAYRALHPDSVKG